VRARWYYGPTRTGKSWKALRDLGVDCTDNDVDMGKVYIKNSLNKWWDGYTPIHKGEVRQVLIDELDKVTSKWVMTYMKRWTDKLPL